MPNKKISEISRKKILKIAREIKKEDKRRTSALIRIFSEMVRTGRIYEANKVLEEALKIAREIKN